MCEETTRRNVMATGVALALAAPFSTLTTASASDDEDWPEFHEWLATVLAYEARDRVTDETAMSSAELKVHDAETDRIFDRIFALAEAVLKRPVLSDRHLAMLTVVACWHLDRKSGHGSRGVGFDLASYESPTGCHPTNNLVLAACKRAAVYFPQVPFVFPAEA